MLVFLMMSFFQVQAAAPPVGLISISPGAELWREVRQRDGAVSGIGQVKSPGADVDGAQVSDPGFWHRGIRYYRPGSSPGDFRRFATGVDLTGQGERFILSWVNNVPCFDCQLITRIYHESR